MDNWQGQFSQGFNTTTNAGTGTIILVILGIIAALGALWFVFEQVRQYRARQPDRPGPGQPTGSQPKLHKYVAIPGRLNPLQQKVIQDMIDDFRKQEPLAQAVPSAILEKYSEFFFNQTDRMKTKDRDVEEFISRNFPLREDDLVELDFQSSGSLHLIKSRVIEIGGKTIIVEYNNPIPEFLKKGTNLQVNYSVGKHFLQGSSQITDVRPDLGLILRKPTQVTLASERRYSRIDLKKAAGNLLDARTGNAMGVKVLDISLEGVRIQVGRPLDKSHIHQLTFEEIGETRKWTFGPIECVPSKAFLTGAGTYESGLLFLYLDVAARTKLIAFMRHTAQEIQAAKAAAEEEE